MNRNALLTLALATSAITASAQRSTINLKQWQFSRDSINYKAVTVPHDWAINGPFDKKWDLQYVAIEQNGEKEKTEKSGRSGALPWIGRGFYKTTVNLKRLPKTAVLEFDGAMADPHVYINGKLAGHWAYGYNAFRVDAAPYLKKGRNEISVSQPRGEFAMVSWWRIVSSRTTRDECRRCNNQPLGLLFPHRVDKQRQG